MTGQIDESDAKTKSEPGESPHVQIRRLQKQLDNAMRDLSYKTQQVERLEGEKRELAGKLAGYKEALNEVVDALGKKR